MSDKIPIKLEDQLKGLESAQDLNSESPEIRGFLNRAIGVVRAHSRLVLRVKTSSIELNGENGARESIRDLLVRLEIPYHEDPAGGLTKRTDTERKIDT